MSVRESLARRAKLDIAERESPTLRRPTSRLLLSDWHPPLRDPIDLLRAAFLVGATVLLVQGTWAGRCAWC